MTAPSDENLVRAVIGGDKPAYGQLYDRYAPLVRAICYGTAGNLADAQDMAQDVFLRAYDKLSTLRDPHRFGSWLVSIAHMRCKEYDGKHYEEALEAFQLTEELERPNLSVWAFASVVWQGHVNDLLGQRQEALRFYNKALSMAGDHEMRHGQYGIRLNRRWLRERLETPFRPD